MYKFFCLIVFTAAICALNSCTEKATGRDNSSKTVIEDKRWEIIRIEETNVEGSPRTHYINFRSNEGQIEAKANCNTILRKYTIRKDNGIKFDRGISSKMACPDDIEDRLQDALNAVNSYQLDGDQLSLGKGGTKTLITLRLVDQ